MTAIVTDVHYRMSPALIRDLGEAGVTVITCERESHRDNPASPALGALSKYSSRHVWLPEKGAEDALLALCREISLKEGARPALLPVGAATLAQLAERREEFEAVCGLCIPTPEQLALFNDKEAVQRLAEELSVPHPKNFFRREDEPLSDFFARLPLPCVIKPKCGERLGLTARDRYLVAKTAQEAETAYLHFQSLAGEAPVVQTFLPGGGLGCSVLAVNGKIHAAICHRRLREYPISGGPSSCCVSLPRPDLVQFAAAMTEKTGYTGLAMFEFKEDAKGNPWLLEVNPRIWGTFPLTRVSKSGIPLLWCKAALNELPEAPPAPPRVKRMTFTVSDLMAGLCYGRAGKPGKLLGAVGDLLNPAVRDGVFEWKDPKPGLAYFRSLLTKERRS